MDNRYYKRGARQEMRPMPSGDGSCECARCKELLCKLREVDFAIYDLALYLDVYPECAAAEKKICELRALRVKLAAEYGGTCGALSFFAPCEEGVSWQKTVNAPAPWEYCAN